MLLHRRARRIGLNQVAFINAGHHGSAKKNVAVMKECINKDERQNAPFESLILVNPSFTTSTMSPMPSGISYYTLISLERMLPVPPLQSYWSWTWKHWMINALLRFDIIYFGKWFCIRALILPFATMMLPLLTLKYCRQVILGIGIQGGFTRTSQMI